MMEGKSILEALADERLVVRHGRLEKRSPYKKLKNQMEHCIKELLSQVGREKRPLVQEYYVVSSQLGDLYARDSYCLGFRQGALSTIEIWESQDYLIRPETIPGEPCSAPCPPFDHKLGGKRFYILNALRRNALATVPSKSHPNKAHEALKKQLHALQDQILGRSIDYASAAYTWFEEMERLLSLQMDMKKSSRYSYGYSTGALLLTELFSDRWQTVEA